MPADRNAPVSRTFSMTHNFHGIVPVMITPFDDNNRIDWDGYARLIEW